MKARGGLCQVLLAAFFLLLAFGEAFQARPSHSKARIHAELYLQSLYLAKKQSRPESEDNLLWLKDRYKLSDTWVERLEASAGKHSSNLRSMDRSVLVDRINNLKTNLKLTNSQVVNMLEFKSRILGSKEDTVNAAVQFLEEYTDSSKSDLRKIFFSSGYVTILALSKQKLKENLGWIETQFDLMNDRKGLKRMLSKFPALLGFSVHENLQPTFDKIQERLCLSHKQTAEMIKRQPQILSYNFEKTLEPKIRWFEERLALKEGELGQAFWKQPCLFTMKIETIQHRMQWLQQRLDLSPKDSRRIILRAIPLVTFSPQDKLQPKLQWLEDNLELDLSQLRKIVVTTPSLLTVSIPENLQPTLEFYKMHLGEKEAPVFLRSHHIMLTYGLESRLKPRVLQLHQRGLEINESAFYYVSTLTVEKWEIYLEKQSAKREQAS